MERIWQIKTWVFQAAIKNRVWLKTIISLGLLVLAATSLGCRLDDNRLRGNIRITAQPLSSPISPQFSYAGAASPIQFFLTHPITGSHFDPKGNPISFACLYDQTVDGEVDPGQSCSDIEGLVLTEAGEFNWTPSHEQEGIYEFKITFSSEDKSESQIFTVQTIGSPGFAIHPKTANYHEDSQPQLVVSGGFSPELKAQIFSDAECRNLLAEKSPAEFSHSVFLTPPPLDPGEHNFYFRLQSGEYPFPCRSQAIDYEYRPALRITMAAGTASTIATLREDGSVRAWGLSEAELPDESTQALLQQDVQMIIANNTAFAALKSDGSVVTWGISTNGGDSSGVAADISAGVVNLYHTNTAFAALKADGSVVTWGSSGGGGDSSAVSADLNSIVDIFSTGSAFAALNSGGGLITWGAAFGGGNSTSVASNITADVVSVKGTQSAFAALKSNGSVVIWGFQYYGGEFRIHWSCGYFCSQSTAASGSIASGVVDLASTERAFAAIKSDGSVVTWGWRESGAQFNIYYLGSGGSFTTGSPVGTISSEVNKVYGSSAAFLALKNDGSLVTWGNNDFGADSSSVDNSSLSPIISVFKNPTGFALLREDGSVTSWGGLDFPARWGSETPGSEFSPSPITDIHSTSGLFIGVRADGSATIWGADKKLIALSTGINEQLINLEVRDLASYSSATALLTANGRVLSYGHGGTAGERGDSSKVGHQLQSGIVDIVANAFAFVALTADGRALPWGSRTQGGNFNWYNHNSAPIDSGVVKVFASERAFAAIKNDGSVVTWGSSGASMGTAATQLSGKQVTDIAAISRNFIALTSDGEVVGWGSNPISTPGDVSSGVVAIRANYNSGGAFAALKSDGSVITWGEDTSGGHSTQASAHLSSGVTELYAPRQRRGSGGFIAVKGLDYALTWWGTDGYEIYDIGEDVTSVTYHDGVLLGWLANGTARVLNSAEADLQQGVIEAATTSSAFAVRKADGSVRAWGHPSAGGDISEIQEALSRGVTQIVGSRFSFAALKNNGSVVIWPSTAHPHLCSGGIVQLFASGGSVLGQRQDGSLVDCFGRSFGAPLGRPQ